MAKRRHFSREFKVEAVKLVTERGVSIAQAARDLDVHETMVRTWVKEIGKDPEHVFPGKGVMKPEQAEIERLKKEVAKLKMERDILKKSRGLLRQGLAVKFVFVAKHRGIRPVAMLCGALGVSRSGYYAWLERAPSSRSVKHEALSKLVRQSFIDSDRTYGARRVWRDVLASGVNCGLHLVEKLMQRQALRARPRRRGLPKDAGERSAIADNVLDRQFTADAPNQKWVADFTYIWTAEGWLYVAVVLDLYSRRAVGWSKEFQHQRAYRKTSPVRVVSPLSKARSNASRISIQRAIGEEACSATFWHHGMYSLATRRQALIQDLLERRQCRSIQRQPQPSRRVPRAHTLQGLAGDGAMACPGGRRHLWRRDERIGATIGEEVGRVRPRGTEHGHDTRQRRFSAGAHVQWFDGQPDRFDADHRSNSRIQTANSATANTGQTTVIATAPR